MADEHVVITCRDCEFRKSFGKLGPARVALDDHESETGHDVDWQINRVEAGVEQAGADAGVCGAPECTNPDSPLVGWPNTDDS